jgi:hypothetical protein
MAFAFIAPLRRFRHVFAAITPPTLPLLFAFAADFRHALSPPLAAGLIRQRYLQSATLMH